MILVLELREATGFWDSHPRSSVCGDSTDKIFLIMGYFSESNNDLVILKTENPHKIICKTQGFNISREFNKGNVV